MNPFSIVYGYVLWHYSKAFADILTVWANMFSAVAKFFSVWPLLKTFFAPWKRMQEGSREGDMEDLFASIVVNLISRIIGMLFRFFLIITGTLVLLVMLVGLLAFVLVWVMLPILAVASSVFGFTLL